MTKTMTKNDLLKRIETFLASPEGDGYSWPLPSDAALEELNAIIAGLADLKFKRDCDGDQVVQWMLADRKRYTLLNFTPYPRIPPCVIGERMDERERMAFETLDAARINAYNASERMREAIREVKALAQERVSLADKEREES